MFKSINNLFLLLSMSFSFIFLPKIHSEYLLLAFFSILTYMSYYLVLHINFTLQSRKSYTKVLLGLEVFIYSFLFIVMHNLISYFYNGNFFVFSEADAFFYHKETLKLLPLSFFEAIEHYLTFMELDDLGMILILYPLYHIAESNLILNFFYLFVGLLTALSIFNLSQNFMTRKYAFLSSLAYSLSSFVMFFHSSGLKESFMILLIILSFDYYYKFVKTQSIKYLISALIFMGLLLLFRPAVAIIILGSIGISSLLSKKGGISIKIISFFIFIFLIFMSNSVLALISTYTAGGIDGLMEARESQGSIIGNIYFTYMINSMAQMIGPLPTILSSEKILTIFYTSGLVYRVLIAFPFWLGVIYIYKMKNYNLYPLIFFVLIEMLALIFLMDGLELRKAMPHIPIVFIISFWFMDQYDREFIKIRRKRRFKRFFYLSIFFLMLLTLYWNFR